MPAGSVTSRALIAVVAIMGFLLSLTAGGVYMIDDSRRAWLSDVSSEVTIQVKPVGTTEQVDRRAQDITDFLTGQNGVREVKLVTRDETAKLIEPWLGQVSAIQDLPFPRMIAVELDLSDPPDITTLRGALQTKFPEATLDDHRAWRQQIRRVTQSLALAGIAVMVLMGAATIGIIVSAARSAIASNKDIVEVLNFVGAQEKFIARQFELHFLKVGIKAGVVGAAGAALVFLTLPIATNFLSGSATDTEIHKLVGTGRMDFLGYCSLLLVVVIVSALCSLTSRIGVRRILNAQNH